MGHFLISAFKFAHGGEEPGSRLHTIYMHLPISYSHKVIYIRIAIYRYIYRYSHKVIKCVCVCVCVYVCECVCMCVYVVCMCIITVGHLFKTESR